MMFTVFARFCSWICTQLLRVKQLFRVYIKIASQNKRSVDTWSERNWSPKEHNEFIIISRFVHSLILFFGRREDFRVKSFASLSLPLAFVVGEISFIKSADKDRLRPLKGEGSPFSVFKPRLFKERLIKKWWWETTKSRLLHRERAEAKNADDECYERFSRGRCLRCFCPAAARKEEVLRQKKILIISCLLERNL